MGTRQDMIFNPNANPPVWRDGPYFYSDRPQPTSQSTTSQSDAPSDMIPSESPAIRATPAQSPAEQFLRQEPLQHAALAPLEPSASSPQTSQAKKALSKLPQDCRVLIVEDDVDNRFYAECAVEDFGCQWASTGLGHMTLPLAIAYRPDIILLDIWLKETTGFEIIRQLQRHCQTIHIPTIAVTALSMPKELNQISAAGFASYLLKPYLLEDLSRILSAYLPKPAHYSSQINQVSSESR